MMEVAALKKKMFRSSLIGLFRVGLAIPLYLVLTPFVLHKLGSELFGIWSLSTVMVSLITLTDFGFKNSLVYYVAKEIHRQEEINKHFNVTFWTYMIMMLAVLIGILSFRNGIVNDLLHVPYKFHDEAVFTLIITVVSFGLRFLAAPYQAVIEGHQEIYYSQLVFIVWLILNFVGTIIALLVSPDIYSLGIVSFISNLVVFNAFYWRVRKFFPFIWISLTQIERNKIKMMIKYGVGIHIATLVIAIREPFYKILIARTYDLASVATFEITYKLCTQIVSVVVAPLLGTFAASALLTQRKEDLGKILRPLVGFTISIFVPTVLFFESFSTHLIRLWLGSGASNVGKVLPMMFTAFAVYYLTETLYKTIQGSGFSQYSAFIQIVAILTNISVFFLFVSNRTWSVPLSLLAGFLLFSLGNYLTFKRRFKNISLIQPMQVFWLMIPTCAYLLTQLIVREAWLPLVFFVYIIIHLLCVKNAKIFDFIEVAKKCIAIKQI